MLIEPVRRLFGPFAIRVAPVQQIECAFGIFAGSSVAASEARGAYQQIERFRHAWILRMLLRERDRLCAQPVGSSAGGAQFQRFRGGFLLVRLRGKGTVRRRTLWRLVAEWTVRQVSATPPVVTIVIDLVDFR